VFELTGANLDGQLVTTLTIQFTAWLKLHYNGNWRENSKVETINQMTGAAHLMDERRYPPTMC